MHLPLRALLLQIFLESTFVHGHPVQEKRQVGAYPPFVGNQPQNAAVANNVAPVEPIQTMPVQQPNNNPPVPTNVAVQEPLPPSITLLTSMLTPIDSTLRPGPTGPLANPAPNIFVPMEPDPPVSPIPARGDHMVSKVHVRAGEAPIQTNKFYANLFLGDQNYPVFTHPYHMYWAKGKDNNWGMSVAHLDRRMMKIDEERKPPKNFITPGGVQNIAFTAEELGPETRLYVDDAQAFSASANFAPSARAEKIMKMPLVQGMGFVTAIYYGARPVLRSETKVRNLEYVGNINSATYKLVADLTDDTTWLIYVTPASMASDPAMRLIRDTRYSEAGIVFPPNFSGIIQVAKSPAGNGEDTYDFAAGAFPTNASISATVDGYQGSYTLQWNKEGVPEQELLMFALPHMVESFDAETTARLQNVTLVTTTKGYARAILGSKMTMIEDGLPSDIGFDPPVASVTLEKRAPQINLDTSVLEAFNNVAALELGVDFDKATNQNSMYYSGKAMAKYANLINSLHSIGRNTQLAAAGLVKLKDAFNTFVQNRQQTPLAYDNVWKGLISTQAFAENNRLADFGNAIYNDHHFHYGYFVYAASVIGHLEPEWLDQGTNRAWVDMLVRDYANPSTNDPYYPFQRAFDWYHGHSWAKGLDASGDSKDQESTSEDTFASYALKMWGMVSGDANMEARGNLMLAVQRRSLRNYFLLSSDNKNQPPEFVPNKVTGILFEAKVDYTTYFGNESEYIHGIQMLPLSPISLYTRGANFVREEWDAFFSNGRADAAEGGWKNILYGNLALVDPEAAFQYFSSRVALTPYEPLDNGASLGWYLAYSAAMMQARGGDPSVAIVDPVLPDLSPPAAQELPAQAPTPQEPPAQVPPVQEPPAQIEPPYDVYFPTPSVWEPDTANQDSDWEWYYYTESSGSQPGQSESGSGTWINDAGIEWAR